MFSRHMLPQGIGEVYVSEKDHIASLRLGYPIMLYSHGQAGTRYTCTPCSTSLIHIFLLSEHSAIYMNYLNKTKDNAFNFPQIYDINRSKSNRLNFGGIIMFL